MYYFYKLTKTKFNKVKDNQGLTSCSNYTDEAPNATQFIVTSPVVLDQDVYGSPMPNDQAISTIREWGRACMPSGD